MKLHSLQLKLSTMMQVCDSQTVNNPLHQWE